MSLNFAPATRYIRSGRDRLLHSRWNPLRTLVRVDTADPAVALTFDDGPDPEYTPRVFDILDRADAAATFFMIGEAARRHPDLVQEAAVRGHAVANHTDTHPSLPTIPSRQRRRQIRRGAAAIAPHGLRLLRPPKGHQSFGSRLDTFWCGHRPVGWSVAVDDWRSRKADRLASEIIERLAPGEIVLLHDGLWDPESPEAVDRQPMLEAVRIVLERCGGNYAFVTLPDLLERGRPVREHWFRDPAAREGKLAK